MVRSTSVALALLFCLTSTAHAQMDRWQASIIGVLNSERIAQGYTPFGIDLGHQYRPHLGLFLDGAPCPTNVYCWEWWLGGWHLEQKRPLGVDEFCSVFAHNPKPSWWHGDKCQAVLWVVRAPTEEDSTIEWASYVVSTLLSYECYFARLMDNTCDKGGGLVINGSAYGDIAVWIIPLDYSVTDDFNVVGSSSSWAIMLRLMPRTPDYHPLAHTADDR